MKVYYDKTTFVRVAKKVHGNKYSYDKIELNGSMSKIIINCSKHGDWKQLPIGHLKGFGCARCNVGPKVSLKKFIAKAREAHGDKYSYDKVNYKGGHKKVTITCSEHGDFEQTPSSHVYRPASGCPRCAFPKKSNVLKVIDKFHKRHGDRYIYKFPCLRHVISIMFFRRLVPSFVNLYMYLSPCLL